MTQTEELTVVEVPCCGDVLEVGRDVTGGLWVAVAPFLTALGITIHDVAMPRFRTLAQAQEHSHGWPWPVRLRRADGADLTARPAVPLAKLNDWLACINEARVEPARLAKLASFRAEAAKACIRAWREVGCCAGANGQDVRPAAPAAPPPVAAASSLAAAAARLETAVRALTARLDGCERTLHAVEADRDALWERIDRAERTCAGRVADLRAELVQLQQPTVLSPAPLEVKPRRLLSPERQALVSHVRAWEMSGAVKTCLQGMTLWTYVYDAIAARLGAEVLTGPGLGGRCLDHLEKSGRMAEALTVIREALPLPLEPALAG